MKKIQPQCLIYIDWSSTGLNCTPLNSTCLMRIKWKVSRTQALRLLVTNLDCLPLNENLFKIWRLICTVCTFVTEHIRALPPLSNLHPFPRGEGGHKKHGWDSSHLSSHPSTSLKIWDLNSPYTSWFLIAAALRPEAHRQPCWVDWSLPHQMENPVGETPTMVEWHDSLTWQ